MMLRCPIVSQMNPIQTFETCFSTIYFNLVAYFLKARTVNPEEPLPANGSQPFVSRQRRGKNVPTVTDTHATTVVLLETAISTQSVQTEDNWGNQVISV
jgi:hypothetical protein